MKILQWFWRKLKFQPPTIYIIRGVSGSGKSTLAGQLTPWNVAADDFPDLYKGGKYNADLQSASHRWCEKSVEDLMQQGRRVIAVHREPPRSPVPSGRGGIGAAGEGFNAPKTAK